MFCFRSSTFMVATLTLATLPCTTAQAQTAKVVPPSATTTEGSTNSFLPFYFDAGHSQQVWTGSAVARSAAVLNSINFRWDGANASYPAFSLSKHVVTIGHTSVSPATISMTFSANITSTMTTIHSGAFSVAAAKPQIPAPFNVSYPMSTPYIYTPSKGNLLMEWIVGSGSATRKGIRTLDAVPTSTGGSGAVRQFGTWGKFAGNYSATWKSDAQKLTPGGSADISLSGFKQVYAAKLFVGASDKSWNGLSLPYDLGAIGAPGNNLYTGLDAIVPFTLTQNPNGFGANPIFPIPNDNKLIGLKAFIQSYYADAKANAAGLVSSDAMELTIGNPGPISKIIGTDGTTRTTAQYNTPPPVVQFVGAIN